MWREVLSSQLHTLAILLQKDFFLSGWVGLWGKIVLINPRGEPGLMLEGQGA
jgi:hypothetical protein